MDKDADLLVIGGGPAGLMAAAAATAAGCRVRVCERLPSAGRKLLTTGGGRCNLTNTASLDALIAAFGRQGRFLQPAVSDFAPPAIRDFFAEAGVPTAAQSDGCVFPVSQRARDVLEALLRLTGDAGVKMEYGCLIRKIVVREGAVAGVETATGFLAAPRVILSAGGRSYPALGSDGSGLALATAAGHTLVTPVPALVPLITQEDWPKQLAGIVLEQARVRLDRKGQPREGRVGPVLFTHRGVSGPPVLDISGAVAELLAADAAPVRLLVAPRTDRTAAAWRALFDSWRSAHGKRALRNLLSGELPRKLAESLCEQTGLGETTPAQARREQLDALTSLCVELPLTITQTEGWEHAMVTRGGVSLTEVDPRSLQSRRVSGLFFAGEILDLDGPCGGYNLTWALASGRLAGKACAQAAGLTR
ncbi:MAG: NAD(P)/FAD-dependent oxidoreductase [bacterium]